MKWKTGDIVYVVNPHTAKLMKANIIGIKLHGYIIKETRGAGRKEYFVSNVIPLEEIERYKLKIGSNVDLGL